MIDYGKKIQKEDILILEGGVKKIANTKEIAHQIGA